MQRSFKTNLNNFFWALFIFSPILYFIGCIWCGYFENDTSLTLIKYYNSLFGSITNIPFLNEINQMLSNFINITSYSLALVVIDNIIIMAIMRNIIGIICFIPNILHDIFDRLTD